MTQYDNITSIGFTSQFQDAIIVKTKDDPSGKGDERMEEQRAGSRRLLGNGLLVLTALIWGMAFVAQRQGMDSIGPITFCAARMVLSAVAVGWWRC